MQKNLHFAACNATVSAGNWIRATMNATRDRAKSNLCAQFCDHISEKAPQRRIVQQGFVGSWHAS